MNNHLSFRQACISDLPAAWNIVHAAALDMKIKGRNQWDEYYPQYENVEQDILVGHGLVLEDEARNILAYTALSFCGEAAYDALEGEWITQSPAFDQCPSYAVIHRTAVHLSHRGKGLARLLFEAAENFCRTHVLSIRIDTNFDNVEMLALLDRLHYLHCGRVWYERDGQPIERMAFEKVINLT